MNFKKLSKEKRNHLILVALLTVGTLCGLGFGPIRYQYDNLKHIADRKATADKKLAQMQEGIKHADRVEAEYASIRTSLTAMEEDLPSGDLYAWVVNTLRRFKTPYKVEVPQFSQISDPSPMTLIPNFPYKQASLTIAGSACYHDLGRFLADFENQFPHIRVLNLKLDSNPGSGPEPDEKLSFSMEIITLVKPNAS